MRNKFRLTFETWNKDGVKTTETSHMEDDVSDGDLANVEAGVAGLFQSRVELGQKKKGKK